MFAHSKGRMAEWLGSGLQNHLHRFESGSDLFIYSILFFINKFSTIVLHFHKNFKIFNKSGMPHFVLLYCISTKLTDKKN